MNTCETCKTCKTCSHWGTTGYRVKDFRVISPLVGLCVRLSSSDDYLSKDEIIRPAEAVCVSEGIGGEFFTQPDFSCSEWKSS